MVLQKSSINYSLSSGLDTKTDSKIIQAGKLSVLENSVFNKTGTLNKRFGDTQLGTLTDDGTSLTSCLGLGKLQDQLCLFSKQYLYGYTSQTDKWLKVGNIPTAGVSNTTIVANNGVQSKGDIATLNGITVSAWIDVSNGTTSAKYTIINQLDGSTLCSPTTLVADALAVKTISVGNYIIIFAVVGTTVYGWKISSANPVLSSRSTVFSNVHASKKRIDVITISSQIIMGYSDTDDKLVISYVTQNLEPGSPLLGTPSPIELTVSVDGPFALFNYNNTTIGICYKQDAGGLKLKTLNLDFTTLMDTVTLSMDSSARNNIDIDASSNIISIYYDMYNATSSLTYIRKLIFNLTTEAVVSVADFIKSVGLAGKGFKFGDNYYVHTAHASALQPTYFIVRDDGVIVSKFLYQLGGGLPGGYTLASAAAIDDNTFLLFHPKVGRLDTSSSTVSTRTGISISKLDFNAKNQGIQSIELGKQLHIAGGVMSVYDGGKVVESGFHLYPETITYSNAGTGGNLTNGVRQYVVVYEWIDHKGDYYRSAPSIPISVTLAGGTSTQKTTVTFPYLRLTAKTNVTVNIYRTIDAGSIFYRITPINTPVTNDPASDTGSFEDTFADSAIQSNEILYTTGDILDNISPPPANILASYSNRLFMAGTEDKNQVHYTKPYSTQTGLEYNDTFYFQVEKSGGDITALATLDDKLIIFKETTIYSIKGSGPTNAGLNNDLLTPQQITTDAGCSKDSYNSVVNTPLGLMFKSNKGIYLLDRSLATKYIGAPVQDYNQHNVTNAVLIADTNEVRFFTEAGVVLVYNYYYDQWSVFTGYENVSGVVIVNNIQYWASEFGITYKQAPVFTTASRTIKQKIVTGWFAFNQPQGFQRIYELAILGKFKSDHKLVVKLYYDYKDTVRESFTVNAEELFDSHTLGSETLLGEDEVLGGADLVVYQFKFKPSQQKCQGLKISIEDVYSTEGSEGFEMTNIHFVVGLKPQKVFVSDSANNEIIGD